MQSRASHYDICRPLKFRLQDRSGSIIGAGSTLNISRRGLLFRTNDAVGVGAKINMTIRMGPGLIEADEASLQVQGVTLRNDAGSVAVSIEKYGFTPSSPPPPNCRRLPRAAAISHFFHLSASELLR